VTPLLFLIISQNKIKKFNSSNLCLNWTKRKLYKNVHTEQKNQERYLWGINFSKILHWILESKLSIFHFLLFYFWKSQFKVFFMFLNLKTTRCCIKNRDFGRMSLHNLQHKMSKREELGGTWRNFQGLLDFFCMECRRGILISVHLW
jgi:hypothetical protein